MIAIPAKGTSSDEGLFADPIAIIISMPTAILGIVLGCVFLSESISVYTQIGIILLIAMAAKNAIPIAYKGEGNSWHIHFIHYAFDPFSSRRVSFH